MPLIFRDFQPECECYYNDARVSLGTRTASGMTPAKALPPRAPKNGQRSRRSTRDNTTLTAWPPYGGLDKIFASDGDWIVETAGDHGTGASDHPAISVELRLN